MDLHLTIDSSLREKASSVWTRAVILLMASLSGMKPSVWSRERSDSIELYLLNFFI
jgi:hypothetical protein